MAFKIFILITLNLSSITFAQTFTKMESGDLVNDGGQSFGVSWSDLNNDGYTDLFISNGGAAGINAINFLYKNNADGTFSRINNTAINDSKKSIGSSIADYNEDGFPDIAVANRDNQNNLLYINDGNFEFSAVSEKNVVTDGGNSNALNWADYNNDGEIDLFVTNFFSSSFLYKNTHNNDFVRIIGKDPAREINTSISSAWSDFDNDGDQDLFVCNAASSGKENLFYTNNGDSTFSKLSSGDIVKDKRASMGAVWGDYNNDGFQDLFIANQANFSNDLYKNNGNGSFTAIRTGEIVTEKSFSISPGFVDFDNDGDLDLFVTNWQNNKNFLYENSGYPEYELEKVSAGNLTEDEENSMGSAWSDFDNDGDLDLFIANRDDQNNALYINKTHENNWIEILLHGNESNITALGTKIRLKADINGNQIWQLREINAQHGYNSQNDIRAHFGLNQAPVIDSLIIEWPSGNRQIFTQIEVNTFFALDEGKNLEPIITSLNRFNTPAFPSNMELAQNFPNPFNPSTLIEINITAKNNPIYLTLDVFNLLGEKVSTIFKGYKSSGQHRFKFAGKDLPSGIYIYRASAEGFTIVKKMSLIK